MAINKRKVLEAARKYAQKGAQAKALKEFGKLLKLDPRDARLRLEVGDAHRRWGNNAEAIETYKKVAEQYMKEGFDARAVAVYKQIHNLAPEAYDSYEPLADLYQRMGLVSEAILALQTAADGYHKEGQKKEALDLLRKMATLDPTNTTSRIKVADLLCQEELFSAAVNEYVEAGAELERQGDQDGAVGVYERILEIEPDRMETLQLLAGNLVDRGFGERAEPYAKRIVETSPDEPAHYELMATVYRLQKRDDKLVETYRALAELHRRRGDDDQAREILQRYVPTAGIEEEVGIDDETAFAGMNGGADLGESGTFGESITATPDAPLSELADATGFDGLGLDGNKVPTLLDDEMLASSASGDDGSFLTLDDSGAGDVALELDEALDSAPAPAPAPDLDLEIEPEPDQAATPEPEQAVAAPAVVGDPEQLFAEASVYLRYGKRDQAIANLEAIIAQDAEHGAALEKLGEAYAESGDGVQAVSVWLRSAEIARSAGDVEGVGLLRDRIAAIDEAAAAGLADWVADEIEGEAASGSPAVGSEGEATKIDLDAIDSVAAGEPHEIDLDDIEIDLDDPEFSEEISSPQDDEEAAVAVGAAPAPAAPGADSETEGPGSSSAVVQQIGEDLEEADFYMNQGLADEAEVIYKRVLSIAPNHPHALVRLGEVAASRGEDPSATSPGTAASQEVAADGGARDGDEGSELEWNDEIAGPDDMELAPPTLEYRAAEDDPVDPAPEESERAEGSSLEDDLVSQFLAEVSGSEDLRTPKAGGGDNAGNTDDIESLIEIDADIADGAESPGEYNTDSSIGAESVSAVDTRATGESAALADIDGDAAGQLESPIDVEVELADEADAAPDSDEGVAGEAAAAAGIAPEIAVETEPQAEAADGIAAEAEASAEVAADAADEVAVDANLEPTPTALTDAGDGTEAEEHDAAAEAESVGGPDDREDREASAETGAFAGVDEDPSDGAPGGSPEIASPDDSFADSSIDLGEAPELVVPAAAAASEAAASARDDSFDLAAELSGVFDDDSHGSTMSGLGDSGDGFEAVFNEFKKGVSQALSEDDHEAHFDLGIAYREMGLLDDARSEFQAAMLNVDREIECRHMLGMCCFEQEQYEEAISQFEQIAGSPGATEEQQLSAQFELGRGWEALGDRVRARTAWEAVAAVDADFCDVSSLLAALDEPAKPEEPVEDLESFEDLLMEASSDSSEEAAPEGTAEPDPDTDEYESFDGFLDDDDDVETAPLAPEPVDEPEPVAVEERALETESQSEPEPEPDPVLVAEVVEEPEAPRPRKRKKISFV